MTKTMIPKRSKVSFGRIFHVDVLINGQADTLLAIGPSKNAVLKQYAGMGSELEPITVTGINREKTKWVQQFAATQPVI